MKQWRLYCENCTICGLERVHTEPTVESITIRNVQFPQRGRVCRTMHSSIVVLLVKMGLIEQLYKGLFKYVHCLGKSFQQIHGFFKERSVHHFNKFQTWKLILSVEARKGIKTERQTLQELTAM